MMVNLEFSEYYGDTLLKKMSAWQKFTPTYKLIREKGCYERCILFDIYSEPGLAQSGIARPPFIISLVVWLARPFTDICKKCIGESTARFTRNVVWVHQTNCYEDTGAGDNHAPWQVVERRNVIVSILNVEKSWLQYNLLYNTRGRTPTDFTKSCLGDGLNVNQRCIIFPRLFYHVVIC